MRRLCVPRKRPFPSNPIVESRILQILTTARRIIRRSTSLIKDIALLWRSKARSISNFHPSCSCLRKLLLRPKKPPSSFLLILFLLVSFLFSFLLSFFFSSSFHLFSTTRNPLSERTNFDSVSVSYAVSTAEAVLRGFRAASLPESPTSSSWTRVYVFRSFQFYHT